MTDPFSAEMVGFSYPQTEADIVTVSHEHEDHSATDSVSGQPFIISGPGEYEVKEVMIFGFGAFHDSSSGSERGKNTMYLLEMDGLRLAHLGDLGHELTGEQLEELDGVDILFVPVGGHFTLTSKQAAEVVSKIDPKIIIPMHYQERGLNQAVFAKLSPVEEFLKEIGEEVTPIAKLTISRDRLPEERQIVVLERKG